MAIKALKRALFLILLIAASLQPQYAQTVSKASVKHPAWSHNKTIYEVNLRQFTKEGTLKAFEAELPRLKELGVGILWFMPINPIGEVNRKGTLGSYYAVKDYLAVNPEFGTLADFKSVVSKAHKLGMRVIIDWVANHTSWDNVLTKTNPGFYTKDSLGKFMPPVADWSDVIDLNYDNKDLWKYMKDALLYWVKEADIDGYRCDVAGMVPTAFWDYARKELDKVKPVFMLAEAEEPGLHAKAFDMTYGWNLYHLFNSIAAGDSTALAIDRYNKRDYAQYPKDAYRMLFTTNHDENSWNGTEFERLKDGALTFSVLTYTLNGMPLIYTGQEAGLNKRLSFFEHDPVNWDNYKYQDFFKKLNTLKSKNKALLNGAAGGQIVNIENDKGKEVYSFMREKGNDRIVVIANLSGKDQEVKLESMKGKGSYTELFTGRKLTLTGSDQFKLKPWEYLLLTK